MRKYSAFASVPFRISRSLALYFHGSRGRAELKTFQNSLSTLFPMCSPKREQTKQKERKILNSLWTVSLLPAVHEELLQGLINSVVRDKFLEFLPLWNHWGATACLSLLRNGPHTINGIFCVWELVAEHTPQICHKLIALLHQNSLLYLSTSCN